MCKGEESQDLTLNNLLAVVNKMTGPRFDQAKIVGMMERMIAIKDEHYPPDYDFVAAKYPQHKEYIEKVKSLPPGEYHSRHFPDPVTYKSEDAFDMSFMNAILLKAGLIEVKHGVSYRGIQMPSRWESLTKMPDVVDGHPVHTPGTEVELFITKIDHEKEKTESHAADHAAMGVSSGKGA
jgi:hypothetical protein